jgi:hypothetical protein
MHPFGPCEFKMTGITIVNQLGNWRRLKNDGSSISARTKSYFGRSKERELPEVTSSEAALTGSDVTEVIACACATGSRAAFFLL